MDKLENSKIDFNLLSEFPGAKRLGSGAYRVNPCPVCGGKDHFTIYEPHSSKNNNPWWTFSSFNGCCKGGSPLDYLIEVDGLSKEDAIKKLIGDDISSSRSNVKSKTIAVASKEDVKNTYDFSLLVNKLHSDCMNTEGLNYYKSRGLTDTIKAYKLGYSPCGYNEALKDYKDLNINHSNNKSYKYFIPIVGADGVCRNLIARHDNSIDEKQKTWNLKNVPMQLFNQRYLETPIEDKFIFICEGWADALSVEEVNKKAIALNSVQMANKFLEIVRSNINLLKDKIFIIALDSDIAGANATKVIIDGLKTLKLTCNSLDMPQGYKDLNEFLKGDRGAFKNFIYSIENEFVENNLEFSNGASLLEEVFNEVETNYNNGGLKNISTGFNELDKKIGGGLYNGLYILGAGSSIGKTTFVQQIADYIASHGKKVLFFSLEMGKKEMISKTIVRELYIKNSKSNLGARQLLNGDLLESDFYNLGKYMNLINNTVKNIYYLEGNFGTTINDIVTKTRAFKNIHGESPLIIIDYLQAIAPTDFRLGDKQNVDMNISELKRLSRDLDTPVIAISSINRQNYLSYIDFTAFKESGSIEYGADVVIGLQLNVIHQISELKDGKINEKRELYNVAKAETPREIEAVILKNRYGASTGTHNYKYYPKFNLFIEEDEIFKESNTVMSEDVVSLFD